MPLFSKMIAEFIGTFTLVFIGCGSAVFQLSVVHNSGVWFPVVAICFGLAVMTMAYSIGHVSGCHLNPAVSLGLWAAKRFPAKEILPYIAAQVVGAIFGALILYWIANGTTGFSIGDFACNGFNFHSPGNYAPWSAFVAEVIFTGLFLFIIVGSTHDSAPKGFAPIAIGLGLTMIHMVLIPITGCSVNPARSTGPAIILTIVKEGPEKFWAVQQLWVFWIAPLLGGVLGGGLYSLIGTVKREPAIVGDGKLPVEEKHSTDPNAPERFSIGSPRPATPKPADKKPH